MDTRWAAREGFFVLARDGPWSAEKSVYPLFNLLQDRQAIFAFRYLVTHRYAVQRAFFFFLSEEVKGGFFAAFQGAGSAVQNVGITLRVCVCIGHIFSFLSRLMGAAQRVGTCFTTWNALLEITPW